MTAIRRCVAAACLLATALLTLPPQPALAENERTKGTIIGATVGLIIGDGKAAVVGGLVGNLTGAMIKKDRKEEAQAAPPPAPAQTDAEESQ
ncbi:MAG: glycine zipper domain-containing protein [Pseudomonadota bacterium]